jgi:hypothetical protein
VKSSWMVASATTIKNKTVKMRVRIALKRAARNAGGSHELLHRIHLAVLGLASGLGQTGTIRINPSGEPDGSEI